MHVKSMALYQEPQVRCLLSEETFFQMKATLNDWFYANLSKQNGLATSATQETKIVSQSVRGF